MMRIGLAIRLGLVIVIMCALCIFYFFIFNFLRYGKIALHSTSAPIFSNR